MTTKGWPTKSGLLLFSALAFCSLFTRAAHAEKTIAKGDDWEIYTDGRAGAFLSYIGGDGFPTPTFGTDATGTQVQLHDVAGGGWVADDSKSDPAGQKQGTISSMRVRTGFVGNQLGLGTRMKASDWVEVSGYIQLWSYVEADGRQKGHLSQIDVRQGWGRVKAPWGTLTAGRQRGLFSRGATDIDALYAHGWGVGFPANVDSAGTGGPTNGHIGFGVIGSGFAAGFVYASPVLAGLQLTIGVYDPTESQAVNWLRTKWARPEAELNFERPLGTLGKVALFANGVYQPVYRPGYCVQDATHTAPCHETSEGVGYGGRLELGIFHLGLAGHYGKGLGLNYALEVSSAAADTAGNFRTFDGYYVQTQVALGKVDVSAGWGITRVFLTDQDKAFVPDPTDATGARQIFAHSVIKDQMGYSAGVVYHYRPYLHLDLDLFRAQADWYLGEKQVLYAANAGMTVAW